MREPESLDVTFKTSMSEADNCICNACHATGRVMKLTYPTTLYYDGNHLSTKYHEFWLCEKCLEKLAFALDKSPTIDAVSVVRCRECKHFRHYGKTSLFINGKNIKAGWCQRRISYDEEYRMTADDFCSYGERKEGAD